MKKFGFRNFSNKNIFFKFTQNKFQNNSVYKNFCSTQNESVIIEKKYSEILKYLFELNVKNKKLPCFEVYPSQIEILHEPMDFYLAILVINNKLYCRNLLNLQNIEYVSALSI